MAIVHQGRNLLREKVQRLDGMGFLLTLLLVMAALFFAVWQLAHWLYVLSGASPLPEFLKEMTDAWGNAILDREFTDSWLIPLAEALLPEDVSLWWFLMMPLALLCFLITLALILGEFLLLTCWPVLLGLVLLAYPLAKLALNGEQGDIIRAGLEGEKEALELAKQLPDSCHVFTNMMIWHQGKRSETDLIIVGPGGVAVVEVKRWSGRIEGCVEDEKLVRVKKNGEQEEKYNPAAQVSTHVYRLAGYLRENHERIAVQPCVLFDHPDCTVDVKHLDELWEEHRKALEIYRNRWSNGYEDGSYDPPPPPRQKTAKRKNVRIMTVDSFAAFAREISTGDLTKKHVEHIAQLIEQAPQEAPGA